MAGADAVEPDPGLIAAGSAAAAALLGTATVTAGAAAAGPSSLTPSDGLPPLPGAPAPGAGTRYAAVGVARMPTAGGGEVIFYRRRLVPAPEALATAGWEQVQPGDRADLIAGRALGDPTAWWQLCDAAGAGDASELEEPGRRLRVALPEGFPGEKGA